MRFDCMQEWYLESFTADGELDSKFPLRHFPFIIGRSEDCALVLSSDDASRQHAEFCFANESLVLRDLGSTNGTFVNHNRIQAEELIVNGDVLHFGNTEYRITLHEKKLVETTPAAADCTMLFSGSLSNQLLVGTRELEDLLSNKQVKMLFQPIVTPMGEVRAFEILGRGDHPDLPESPLELFSLAESIDKAVELSEIFREVGVNQVAGKTHLPLFLNIHPMELANCDRLLASLAQLRQNHPQQKLMLEVHEQAAADIAKMQKMKAGLTELDISLAYDDFGAGQARMLELVEIPPQCLKFDMSLVRGIANSSEQKRQMLKMLIDLCKQLNIQSLAEGIETRAGAEVCQQLGIDLIQGFYFSRPKTWDEVEKHKIAQDTLIS